MAPRLHSALAALLIAVTGGCSCGSGGQEAARPADAGEPPPVDSGGTLGAAGANGSGGMPGAGGTGTAGAADAQTDASDGWLQDPAAWQVVPASDCELRVADRSKLAVPRREWKSCGSGCSVAPSFVPLGTPASVYARPFAASFRDKQLILRGVAGLLVGGKPANLWLSTAEPEGSPLGALLASDPRLRCTSSVAFRDRADVWHVASNQRHLVARADSPSDVSSPSAWMAYPGVNSAASASGVGWGMGLNNGDLVFRSWTEAAPARVGVDETYSLAVVDDAVVWVGRRGGARAGLWLSRPSESPRALWSSELTAMQMASTSDRRLVWVAAAGPRAAEGAYEKAYWYDGVLTDTFELTNVRQGPEIPATSGLLFVAASGNFAAASGCTQDGGVECSVFVYNWQSQQMWRLRNRPGRFLLEPLAVSDEQVVIGENTANTPVANQSIEAVVVVETSELSRVEAGW